MKREIRHYYRVGLVERGNGKPGYDWYDGYSTEPDGSSQPWLTFRECQREAKSDNVRAVFLKFQERIG